MWARLKEMVATTRSAETDYCYFIECTLLADYKIDTTLWKGKQYSITLLLIYLTYSATHNWKDNDSYHNWSHNKQSGYVK